MGVFRDLAGKRFGRLEVISVADEKTSSGNYQWNCKCDCGSEKVLPSDHLVRRKQPVKSCGCLRNDRVRAAVSAEPDEVAFRLLVGSYVKRARKKEIAFSLSETKFRELTSSDCHYCGKPPEMLMQNRGGTGSYVYNSIDRLNPSKGYTDENSVPCCKICNYMKWTLTERDFISHVKLIAERVSS